jgi:hypothetical protein
MSIQPSPGQRTAITARLILLAGAMIAAEAFLRDSFARGLLAMAIFSGGGLLLAFAKRAD